MLGNRSATRTLADAARLCFWAIERVTLHMIDVSLLNNETHFVHYLQRTIENMLETGSICFDYNLLTCPAGSILKKMEES